MRLLEEEIVLDKKFKHEIEVVVDRLVLKPDLRQRLTQSVETAAALADGLVAVDVIEGESMLFSEKFACPEHGVSLPELQPRIFSFNSPHGACPRCTGLGSQLEIDPDLIVPDSDLTIGEGALVPWSVGNGGFYDSVVQAICDRYEIDPDTPWGELTREQQDLFLYGTNGDKLYVQYRNRMGRRRSYTMAFEGIVASLGLSACLGQTPSAKMQETARDLNMNARFGRMELVVEHTDPGLQGDRSTGGTKPTTLETGAQIQVPLFITTGEKLKVDTRDGRYLGRVN